MITHGLTLASWKEYVIGPDYGGEEQRWTAACDCGWTETAETDSPVKLVDNYGMHIGDDRTHATANEFQRPVEEPTDWMRKDDARWLREFAGAASPAEQQNWIWKEWMKRARRIADRIEAAQRPSGYVVRGTDGVVLSGERGAFETIDEAKQMVSKMDGYWTQFVPHQIFSLHLVPDKNSKP